MLLDIYDIYVCIVSAGSPLNGYGSAQPGSFNGGDFGIPAGSYGPGNGYGDDIVEPEQPERPDASAFGSQYPNFDPEVK